MSERVNKLIKEENTHILNLLHNDEAVCVYANYYLDKGGMRVYDMDSIREQLESNMENLIALNKQRGLSNGEIA